jgi:hypothetical protein
MENMYKEALNTADSNIYVAVHGNDTLNTGSFNSPFASIEKAIAACTTTRKTIVVFPGAYTMAAHVDITVNGTSIIGLGGGVEIDGSACLLSCFKTVFGSSSGTKTFKMENLTLNHGAVVGIQIDNASATAKVILELKDVDFKENGGNSLDIDRAGATGQAVRVYADRCYFEGPINMVVKDHGDRLRLKNCTLDLGIVTDAGAYTAEILLHACIFKVNTITGGASAQIVYFSACSTNTAAGVDVYAGAIANDVQTQSVVICDFDAA